jgi:hypothetical protein
MACNWQKAHWGISTMNLDAVSKEELLQALVYMAGQYLTSDKTNELEHQFMSAGEYACEILARVEVIEPRGYGGKWLIDWCLKFQEDKPE